MYSLCVVGKIKHPQEYRRTILENGRPFRIRDKRADEGLWI